jgi:HNH endonuclease
VCHLLASLSWIHGSFHLQYKSAMTAFDILQNYASLSEKSLQDLEDNIDDPTNGFLLAQDPHSGFDKFQWCLQETEVRPVHSCSLISM